jgi:hypothetical protein
MNIIIAAPERSAQHYEFTVSAKHHESQTWMNVTGSEEMLRHPLIDSTTYEKQAKLLMQWRKIQNSSEVLWLRRTKGFEPCWHNQSIPT